jgi:hypothetical protein
MKFDLLTLSRYTYYDEVTIKYPLKTNISYYFVTFVFQEYDLHLTFTNLLECVLHYYLIARCRS